MPTIEKVIPLKVEITPAELGKLFAGMHSDEQAEFFNAVSEFAEKEYPDGPGSFCIQMQYVTDELALTAGARSIMRIIGDYSTSS